MTSSQLRCVLWVICCLLSIVNTLLERRGIGKVQRRDNHGLYPRTTQSYATDKFVSGIKVAVQQLNAYHRPLLVHTKDGVRCCWKTLWWAVLQTYGWGCIHQSKCGAGVDLSTPFFIQQSDVLLYVREDAENFTVPISVSSYSNLQVRCSVYWSFIFLI